MSRATRRQITVDDFSGQSAAEAIESARLLGLRPAPERVEVDDVARHGIVVGHDPKPGETATRGSLLALFVGAVPPAAEELKAPVGPSEERETELPANVSETDLGLPRADAADADETVELGDDAPPDFHDESLPEPPFALLDPFFETPAPSAEPPRRRRSKRLYVIAAGAIVLLALALALAVAAPTRHGVSEPRAADTKTPPTAPAPVRRHHEWRPQRQTKRHRRRETHRPARTAAATEPAHAPDPATAAPAPPTYVAPRASAPAASPEDDEFFGA